MKKISSSPVEELQTFCCLVQRSGLRKAIFLFCKSTKLKWEITTKLTKKNTALFHNRTALEKNTKFVTLKKVAAKVRFISSLPNKKGEKSAWCFKKLRDAYILALKKVKFFMMLKKNAWCLNFKLRKVGKLYLCKFMLFHLHFHKIIKNAPPFGGAIL